MIGGAGGGWPGSDGGGCPGSEGAFGCPPVMRTNEFHAGLALPFSFSSPDEEQNGQFS